MLMRQEEAALLIIDVQTRLIPAVHDEERIRKNCVWLADLAQRMSVPVVATEHFPAKIGSTIPEIKAVSSQAHYVGKAYFSAWQDGCLKGGAIEKQRQIVICGIEAHVCVMQCALDLHKAGKKVFVVADAVGSREDEDRQLALMRMRTHGIQIVSHEMVAFEWLQRGGTDLFREIHRDFIK